MHKKVNKNYQFWSVQKDQGDIRVFSRKIHLITTSENQIDALKNQIHLEKDLTILCIKI